MKILVFFNQQKLTYWHCLNRQIQAGNTTPTFNPNNPLMSFSHSSLVDSAADELRPTCDQSLHITHTPISWAGRWTSPLTCKMRLVATPSTWPGFPCVRSYFTLYFTTLRFSTPSQLTSQKSLSLNMSNKKQRSENMIQGLEERFSPRHSDIALASKLVPSVTLNNPEVLSSDTWLTIRVWATVGKMAWR